MRGTARAGRPPLHWAAENGHEALVRVLLEAGRPYAARLGAAPSEMASSPRRLPRSGPLQPPVKL